MLILGERLFDRHGYMVVTNAIAKVTRARAWRAIWLAVREYGLTAEQIVEWDRSTYFPHLRWETAILDLLPRAVCDLYELDHPLETVASVGLPDARRASNLWGDPQILLRLPNTDTDVAHSVPVPHTDSLPPWADDTKMRYPAIFGAGLNDAGLVVWPGSHRRDRYRPRDIWPVTVTWAAGDVLVMHPRLEHAGLANPSGEIKATVWFRPVVTGADSAMGKPRRN